MRLRVWNILFLLPILLIGSCSKQNFDREDLHVFRSVLDDKPRMATLFLEDSLCLAFDTEHCGIYKIWKGGIRKEGAVFTHIKNVQPTSWGDVFFEEDLTSFPISVYTEGKKLESHHQFKGYEIGAKAVYFKYTITVPGFETIDIKEKYSIKRENGKDEAILRHFEFNNLDEKLTLELTDLKGGMLKIKDEIYTTEYQLQEVHFNTPKTILSNTDEHRGKLWYDKSDCGSCHNLNSQSIGPSLVDIANRYAPTHENIELLSNKIKKGGSGTWGEIMMIPHPKHSDEELNTIMDWVLSLATVDHGKTKATKRSNDEEPEENSEIKKSPGFGLPLEEHHPSYDLLSLRKASFEPYVGGMDVDEAGNLYISTWDSLGAVYKLEGIQTADTSKIVITQIAVGLAEPLGLKVVDGEIFVLQKQELTQLVDNDKDGITDEYRTISNAWEVSTDFHEFAFGLEYKDGYFYASLSLGMRVMRNEKQKKERGTVIKIKKEDGSIEVLCRGLRTPNGIGFGLEGELFVTDNQGQWLPGNKLIHIQQGAFYGNRDGDMDLVAEGIIDTPPAVWLPDNEIANSPSEPILVKDDIYKNQMLYGDVTHGGIKRIFLEKVNRQFQGCVFRHSQGFEAGVNRLVYAPNGALYVGEVGMNGGWSWKGTQFGLQQLRYNGKTTFEVLSVSATSDGFTIEFTEPVADVSAITKDDIILKQWRYEPTIKYGGPKIDLEALKANQLDWSEDKKTLHLKVKGLKKEHVVYFFFKKEAFKNIRAMPLWTGETWYTLNQIPSD
jgi:cytochrome c